MAARRTRRRRNRASESPAVLRWLQVGAVAAGVSAAVAAGQAVATADTGDSGTDNSTTTSSTGSDTDTAPERDKDAETDADADPDDEDADDAEADPEPEDTEAEPEDTDPENTDETESHDPVELPDDVAAEPEPAADDHTDRTSYRASDPTPAPIQRVEVTETVSETAEVTVVPDIAAVPDVAAPVITTFARNASASTTSIAPVTPTYPAQVTQTPVTWQSIASDLLAWAGMGTLAADSDIPALPVNRFIEALWLDVRRIHYTYMNSYPHATPTQVWQDPNTSTVYGTIGGYDADGDQLTYTVSEEPQRGSVSIVNGVYTYIPNPEFASTGGTDTFVVTVEDDGPENPWHTHGFSQILQTVGLTGPSTATVTVTVDGTGDPVVVGTPTSIDGAAQGNPLLAPDGTRVIQTTTNGNIVSTVTIINTADGSIVGTPITIDEYASLPPVLTPNGAQVVLSTIDLVSGDTTVTVINTADGSVAGSSTFAGAFQTPAVVNADSTRAYVVTYDGSSTLVTIIDLSDGSIAGQNDQAAGEPAGKPVLSPDGSLVYQSSRFSSSGTDFTQVTIFDATNGDCVGTATFSGIPTGPVVISPDGQHAIQTTYYAPLNKSIITVFDSNGDYVGEAQAPGGAVGDPVFSEDGARAYQTVTTYDSGLDSYVTTIVMLDGATGTKLGEHQVVGTVVQGLRISKDGSTAVQTSNGVDGAIVTVIDTSAGTFADVQADGFAADGPAIISADGTLAAVVTRSGPGDQAFLTLINATTGTPAALVGASGTNAFGRLTQSADGTKAVAMLYGGGYTTPVFIDFELSSITVPDQFQGIPTGAAGFSSDGSYVAAPIEYFDPDTLTATRSLIIVELDGISARVVGQPVELPSQVVGAPVLSPDGSRVIQTTNTMSPGAVTTVTIFDTQPVAPPPPPPVDDVVTVRSVLADLLLWTGLGTLSPTAGIPDIPLPGFLQNAWRAVSDIHYTLWNSYPHAAPTQVWQNPDTGAVIGTIGRLRRRRRRPHLRRRR